MLEKILFLSNHFITLYNFRKELISELIKNGNKVYISMPKDENNTFFSDMGCTIIETPMDRRNITPIGDLRLIFRYITIMKSIKPDVIFSYTIKPNIYGSIASNITKYKQISNITGTGATFLKDNFISKFVKLLYRISIKKSYKVFFQNKSDKDFFIQNNIIDNNFEVIPGSGVNLSEYTLADFPEDEIVNFIFIGRIMEVKGIDLYLYCAKIIKKKYPNTNFYIAGFIEEDRYQKIIDDYHKKGIIIYLGFQKDIKSWIKKCHCTILPSYGGEGIPNVLLESAAIGRVSIASNISGSKEVIEHGVTGYLFDNRNGDDLISQVEKFLAMSSEAKKKMGVASRKKVEKEFDRLIVVNAYLNEVR